MLRKIVITNNAKLSRINVLEWHYFKCDLLQIISSRKLIARWSNNCKLQTNKKMILETNVGYGFGVPGCAIYPDTRFTTNNSDDVIVFDRIPKLLQTDELVDITLGLTTTCQQTVGCKYITGEVRLVMN
mgnify:CR=1 FL=1